MLYNGGQDWLPEIKNFKHGNADYQEDMFHNFVETTVKLSIQAKILMSHLTEMWSTYIRNLFEHLKFYFTSEENPWTGI